MQQHPKTRAVAKGVLDVIPALTGTAGAALGVPMAPETLGASVAAGGALGVGVGRGARDLIAEAIGVDDPSSPLSKGARIALDTAVAAAFPVVAEAVHRAVTNPRATLADVLDIVFHPQTSADQVVSALRQQPSVLGPAQFSGTYEGGVVPGTAVTSATDLGERAAQAASPPAAGYGEGASHIPTVKQAIYVKTADGFGLAPAVEGETLTPGERVNVTSRSGAQRMVTVPGATTPESLSEFGKRLFGKEPPVRPIESMVVPGHDSFRYGVTGSPVTQQITADPSSLPRGESLPTSFSELLKPPSASDLAKAEGLVKNGASLAEAARKVAGTDTTLAARIMAAIQAKTP
jgi:hypothetical protein